MTRRQAREEAFYLIFELAFGEETVLEERTENAKEARGQELDEFSLGLVQHTVSHIEELDRLIEQHATKWTKSRISKVSLAVLRLAMAEMFYEDSVPVSVSINEAVELAKKFGGEEDSSFINGVLGAVAKAQSGEGV